MPIPYLAQQTINDFGHLQSDIRQGVILVAGAEQTLTVPGSAKKFKAVIHSAKAGDVWMAVNEAAVLPTAVMGAVNCELNPVCREVKAGDTLSFISNQVDVQVGVVFYSI